MKLTVVIHNFNASTALVECLNSIINQTYQDMDILIFDRGSTDMSRNVMENFTKSDSRIKLTQGFVKSEGQGQILFEIDSKNKLIHLDFFKTAMESMIKNPKIGIVSGIVQAFNEKNEFVGSSGKINGAGEQSPFNQKTRTFQTIVSSGKIDLTKTVLPECSSVVKDLSGDVMFLHHTVIRFNGNPATMNLIYPTNEAKPITLPENKPIQVDQPIPQVLKKRAGRPKGSKNKKTEVVISQTL